MLSVPSNSIKKDLLPALFRHWIIWGRFLKKTLKNSGPITAGQVTVSNRFLPFPSSRNRLLGLILFKYDIKGLQWGLNYNSWLSIEEINPLQTAPEEDGFQEETLSFSIQMMMANHCHLSGLKSLEALQDMRALKALSEKKGKDKVLEIINNSIKGKLSYKTTDIKAEDLIGIRERVNMEL